MANKYMKKYSTFLAVKAMHIKTTLRFHLIPVRMAIFKGSYTAVARKDVVKQESLYTGGNAN
jgi:hypothetical protein